MADVETTPEDTAVAKQAKATWVRAMPLKGRGNRLAIRIFWFSIKVSPRPLSLFYRASYQGGIDFSVKNASDWRVLRALEAASVAIPTSERQQ
jgi:hypothetical protein